MCCPLNSQILQPFTVNRSVELNGEEDTSVVTVLWTSIKRHPNKTDLIRPSLCPSPCARLFKAHRVEQPVLGMDDREPSQEELCYCKCPVESPVFMQSAGQCVSKIGSLWTFTQQADLFQRPVSDGCKRAVRVSNSVPDSSPLFAPVIALPKLNEFIKFPGQIMWQGVISRLNKDPQNDYLEARVKIKQKQGPRCNITRIRILRQDSRWFDTNGMLFQLGWSNESNMGGVIVSLNIKS